MENKIKGNSTSRVAELRKERGLSQQELSRILYVDQKTISRAENGVYSVSILTLLADYFGVTIDYILCRSDLRTVETPQISELDLQIIGVLCNCSNSEKIRLIKHIELENSLKLHSAE